MSQIIDSFSGIVINQNGLRTTYTSSITQGFTLPSDYVRVDTIPNLAGIHVFTNAANLTDTLTWTLQVNTGTWVTIASGTQIPQMIGQAWTRAMFLDPLLVDPAWLTLPFQIVLAASGSLQIGLSSGVLMYRLLADVADGGTDFLGNVYRSAVVEAVVENVNTFQSQAILSSWQSNPCPSQFGVEALYFDIRQGTQPAVIDRLTIDPMTPGVYFHVYYSSDPTGPGTDIPSWENLLWTPVYKTFQANRMQTHALPDPITARYLCIEFTNLQARSYNPGNFQLPTVYKKYPQWVLNYFITLWKGLEMDRLSSSVSVIYDALDLGFAYYQDDIVQEPDEPIQSQLPVSQLNPFVDQATITLDPKTLSQVTVDFQPYQQAIGLRSDTSMILGEYAKLTTPTSYSVENVATAVGNTAQVSNFEREALLLEKSFPNMFFFLPSRHSFRIAQALFQTNVAYFAGVNQIILHRDVYTGYSDQAQYNENLGDGTNLLFNDWELPLAFQPLQPLLPINLVNPFMLGT